jgi:hypothetical protein
MSKSEDQIPALEETTPLVSPGNYSPVTVYMRDSLGAIFLGALAGILLIGWVRSEARYRGLITQLEITDGNHPPGTR